MTAERLLWVTVAGLGLLIAVLIVALLIWGDDARKQFEADCAAVGGHVIRDDDTRVGYGYGTGGQTVVVTPSTKYYCLNESGGILAIQ